MCLAKNTKWEKNTNGKFQLELESLWMKILYLHTTSCYSSSFLFFGQMSLSPFFRVGNSDWLNKMKFIGEIQSIWRISGLSSSWVWFVFIFNGISDTWSATHQKCNWNSLKKILFLGVDVRLEFSLNCAFGTHATITLDCKCIPVPCSVHKYIIPFYSHIVNLARPGPHIAFIYYNFYRL